MLTPTGVTASEYLEALKEGNPTHVKMDFASQEIVLEDEDIYIDTGVILTDILNSDVDMVFGNAVSKQISVTVFHTEKVDNLDWTGEFTLSFGVEISGSTNWVTIGTFTGEKPKNLTNEKIVNFVAYDSMRKFDTLADDFFDSITYPITVQGIYNGVCSYVGLTNVAGDELPGIMSRSYAAAPVDMVGYTCRDIISWIAQACGCYATINEANQVQMVWFTDQTSTVSIHAEDEYSFQCAYDEVDPIDQLIVKQVGSDFDIHYPSDTGDNVYQIINNPFLSVSEASEITAYIKPLYDRLDALGVYLPASFTCDGNWLTEAGDIIEVDIDGNSVTIPVFMKTMVWKHDLVDAYETTGNKKRQVYTSDSEKQKVLTAKEISMYVGDRFYEKQSGITIDTNGVTIFGNKDIVISSGSSIDLRTGGTFTVQSGQFSIDQNGNATFGGTLNAAGGTFAGTMSAACITSGTMSANRISGGSIDASNVTITNLNASNITSGTMSANKISGGTIDASNVTINNLDASKITTGTMSASKIKGGTLILGGNNNENGIMQIKNASGTVFGTFNKDGIQYSGNMTISSGGTFNLQSDNANVSSNGGYFNVIRTFNNKKCRLNIGNDSNENVDFASTFTPFRSSETDGSILADYYGLQTEIRENITIPGKDSLVQMWLSMRPTIKNGNVTYRPLLTGFGQWYTGNEEYEISKLDANFERITADDYIAAPDILVRPSSQVIMKGTKATSIMIYFLNNDNDDTGNGISIGGGGPTIIGGGESANTALGTLTPSHYGDELMYVCNDADIHLYTNIGSGWANRKDFAFGSNGNLTVPGTVTATSFSGSLAWSNVTSKPSIRSDLAPTSGAYFRGTPLIGSDGVMEIGKYIDFHASNTTTSDYDARITASTSGLTLSGTTSGTFSGNLTGSASNNVLKSGDTMTGSLSFSGSVGINYVGTKNTYRMISFIDNTSDIYGNGIAIGGGGATIIGGGESATAAQAQVNGGDEIMYVCNDGDIHLLSNMQDGWASRKDFTFNTGGSFTAPGSISAGATVQAGTYVYAGSYVQAVQDIYMNSGIFYTKYNNTWYPIVRNYGNGDIMINAASAWLYLGYQNTSTIDLFGGYGRINSSSLWLGKYSVNTDQSSTNYVGVQSGAGALYLYSEASKTGTYGLNIRKADGSYVTIIGGNQSSFSFNGPSAKAKSMMQGVYNSGNVTAIIKDLISNGYGSGYILVDPNVTGKPNEAEWTFIEYSDAPSVGNNVALVAHIYGSTYYSYRGYLWKNSTGNPAWAMNIDQNNYTSYTLPKATSESMVISGLNASTIPANADFNNYTTRGVYMVTSDSTAGTISNMPVRTSGRLLVLPTLGNYESITGSTWKYGMQIYVGYTAGNVWMRYSATGSGTTPTWGAWNTYLSSANYTSYLTWANIQSKPTFSGGTVNFSWGTGAKIATVAGEDVRISIPSKPTLSFTTFNKTGTYSNLGAGSSVAVTLSGSVPSGYTSTGAIVSFNTSQNKVVPRALSDSSATIWNGHTAAQSGTVTVTVLAYKYE